MLFILAYDIQYIVTTRALEQNKTKSVFLPAFIILNLRFNVQSDWLTFLSDQWLPLASLTKLSCTCSVFGLPSITLCQLHA